MVHQATRSRDADRTRRLANLATGKQGSFGEKRNPKVPDEEGLGIGDQGLGWVSPVSSPIANVRGDERIEDEG